MKSEDILKRTSDLLGAKSSEKEAMKTQLENERRLLITSLAQDISSIIQPTLENMIQANQVTIDSLKQAMREIKVDVPRTEVRMPTINVPRPQVTVSVPEMKIPTVNVPAPVVNFPEKMSVSMDAVNRNAPLPVMMMDSMGKPMTFSMGAGGGGKADFLTIKDIRTSLGASWFNDEGLRVSGSFSVTASNSSTQAIDSSGEPYSQANPMPVVFSSSGSTASALIDSSGVQYSGSNPLPVTITSGGTATSATNIVDSSGVSYSGSNPLPVAGTVVVSSITATTAVANVDSTGIQYSGSNPFPMRIVTDATATVNVVNVDSAGAYRSTFPVSGSVTVASITASTAVNLSDSSGIGYSGSNPVPVTLISGGLTSSIVVGPVVADTADDGSAPVQSGGVARNANPTAVANGDVVKSTHDLVGRQLMRVNQVRNLLQTAYVTEDEIQEVTLLAGATGVYHDLVYVMCANESSAAINLDFRQTTGGTVQMSVEVPATGTAGVSLPMPLPQDHADATWTVKNSASDNSNTVYSVTALFSKEV